jgi:hypothetical protein
VRQFIIFNDLMMILLLFGKLADKHEKHSVGPFCNHYSSTCNDIIYIYIHQSETTPKRLTVTGLFKLIDSHEL